MKKKSEVHSIKTMFVLLIGGAVLLLGVALTAFGTISMRKAEIKDAQVELSIAAQKEGNAIQNQLNGAMDTARNLAITFEAMKVESSEMSRDQVKTILKQILEDNSEFTDIYTIWEPDAFDGKDAEFADTEGYGTTGRVNIGWLRDENQNISYVGGGEVNEDKPYYKEPKETLQEAVIEPYIDNVGGKDILMTSMVVPIVINGEFVGMAGVDISLDFIQSAAESVDLYDGTGILGVISNGGIIAAMKGNPEAVGTSFSDSYGTENLEAIKTGETQVFQESGYMVAFAPMSIGRSTLPWMINIDVPMTEITKDSTQTMIQMIVMAIILVAFCMFIPLLQLNQVVGALRVITDSSKKLSVGDLSVSDESKIKIEKFRKRNDELSEISHSFAELRQYITLGAEDADRIANGDLTLDIHPRSDQDLLANALKKMVESLRDVVSRVMENSEALAASSEQLASAANQSGQATAQIAATIQQVASGTTQQSQAAATTASSVEQENRAIEGVAQGAQEQAQAVGKASTLTTQINEAVEKITANVKLASNDSETATASAKEGARSVEETLRGMEVIKEKVGVSAEKVQDMGARSEKIGVIVETIEDIASQTNLLSLNAAIEAARAGENGKGFAVVADEVRKLAERSAAATREIGELVRGIQKTVAEAVSAMGESSHEVETGVKRANDSGTALQEILRSIETVNEQIMQVQAGGESVSKTVNELVSAIDSVSAVVEENTAATEEMAAGASEVSKAIENIASVSEENSAAVEEVSASAEEMSAQVEEVTASAQSLAEMAAKLTELVSRFRL